MLGTSSGILDISAWSLSVVWLSSLDLAPGRFYCYASPLFSRSSRCICIVYSDSSFFMLAFISHALQSFLAPTDLSSMYLFRWSLFPLSVQSIYSSLRHAFLSGYFWFRYLLSRYLAYALWFFASLRLTFVGTRSILPFPLVLLY